MNLYVCVAAFTLLPAAAFLLAWPKRPWAAWLAAVAGAAGAAACWRAEPSRLWLGPAGLGLLSCLYAAYAAGRDRAGQEALRAENARREERAGELAKAVQEAKLRSQGAEAEQKEVLALYGLVKSLAEGRSWEEIRPKLEVTLQQYLRAEEYALYIAEQGTERLAPLLRRRLNAGVGASWDSLSRCLEERHLSPLVGHVLEAPEPAIVCPILDAGRRLGTLYLRLPRGAEPEVLLAKTQSFLEDIAFAFARIQLFQEVERLSQVDGLTGVYRRGVLDEKLKEEAVRSRTFKTTFCVILLDIDHFKVLNDTYGHPFGDQVLRRVGEILKASVYETDFVARYGGEEFVVLMPRADAAGVLRKAEALRGAIESEVFELAMQRIQVTVSMGVAHFPRDGHSPESVIQAADQALYHAKETGRNKVVDIVDVAR